MNPILAVKPSQTGFDSEQTNASFPLEEFDYCDCLYDQETDAIFEQIGEIG